MSTAPPTIVNSTRDLFIALSSAYPKSHCVFRTTVSRRNSLDERGENAQGRGRPEAQFDEAEEWVDRPDVRLGRMRDARRARTM